MPFSPEYCKRGVDDGQAYQLVVRRMRQLVIDTNILQSERLDRYLQAARENIVVIPDYTAMELYKSNSTENARRNLQILSKYAKQVCVLKSTRKCCVLNGKEAGLRNRMIDWHATREFPRFVRVAGENSPRSDRILSSRMEWAERDIGSLDPSVERVSAVIPEMIEELFSDNDLQIIRKGRNYPLSLIKKIMDLTFDAAWRLFEAHSAVRRIPDAPEIVNTFLFRTCLCLNLQILRWVRTGRVKTAAQRLDRIRNDIIDSHIAAFATFFDGLLSNDQKAESVYSEAAWIIPVLRTRPTADQVANDRPKP